jgi:hypothetical protein
VALAGWTFTTSGFWGGHQYYERIDKRLSPNDSYLIKFDEGYFYAHDVVDFGFLDLVRLGERLPDYSNVSMSLSPSASASDGNSTVQVAMPNGDIYFHCYDHDNYGESNTDCTGWPASGASRFGRLWPVFSSNRWPMGLTTAILCRSRSGTVRTSPVSRSGARRAVQPRSTELRGNTCASLNQSTPAITSTLPR